MDIGNRFDSTAAQHAQSLLQSPLVIAAERHSTRSHCGVVHAVTAPITAAVRAVTAAITAAVGDTVVFIVEITAAVCAVTAAITAAVRVTALITAAITAVVRAVTAAQYAQLLRNHCGSTRSYCGNHRGS